MKKNKSMVIITVMVLLALFLMGANKKLSEMDLLNSLSLGSTDRFYIADVSESVSKAITASELREYAQTGFTASSRAAVIGTTGQIEAGDVTISELSRLDGLTSDIVTTSGTQIVLDKTLVGGSIDNCSIGAATPSSGEFTTLEVNSWAEIPTADINGGSIDGAAIGATSASTGKFTTISASTSVLSPKVTTEWHVLGAAETGKCHTRIYSNYAVADGTASTLDIDLSAIPTGARIIGCQIRVDVTLGVTWGADYSGAGNQKITEIGVSGSANTKFKALFDYSTASGILSGVGGTFKIVISSASTISDGGRVSVFVWYEYFEDVENYSGSGT